MRTSLKITLGLVIMFWGILFLSTVLTIGKTGAKPTEMARFEALAASLDIDMINVKDNTYIKIDHIRSSLRGEIHGFANVDEDGYIKDHWGFRIIITTDKIQSLGQDGISNTEDDLVRLYR